MLVTFPQIYLCIHLYNKYQPAGYISYFIGSARCLQAILRKYFKIRRFQVQTQVSHAAINQKVWQHWGHISTWQQSAPPARHLYPRPGAFLSSVPPFPPLLMRPWQWGELWLLFIISLALWLFLKQRNIFCYFYAYWVTMEIFFNMVKMWYFLMLIMWYFLMLILT